MTRWTSFQRVYLHVEKHMGRNVDERMLIKKKRKKLMALQEIFYVKPLTESQHFVSSTIN